MMLPYREELLTRMIHLYGHEHFIVIQYAHLLETLEENEWNKKMLEILVAAHEASPYSGEGDY